MTCVCSLSLSVCDSPSLPLLQYAEDQGAFFADYALAHAKLSELGSQWEVEGGIKI